MAYDLGADLCGIASVERFEHAPVGFHPTDVLDACKSVIVLAGRFLHSTLFAKSTIPYTDVRNEMSKKMDTMSIEMAYQLENRNLIAVPINAIGPNEWDCEANKSRGIISLKHSAELAGLGRIGKNTLLINEMYGNMIWLGAVLISERLVADPMVETPYCPKKCTLCLDQCPVKALDGISINYKKCWEYAFGTHNGGGWRIKCYHCRKICPNCRGIKDRKNVYIDQAFNRNFTLLQN